MREEEKRQVRARKEKEYINLILSAYKAEPVESFNTFVGKKRDRLVAIGSIDLPITSGLIQDIVKECKEKKITKADVLGFDYEMGLDFEDTKKQGLDISFKKIPREVFDKKAVEKVLSARHHALVKRCLEIMNPDGKDDKDLFVTLSE